MNEQDREAFEGERRAASRWDDEEIPYCHPGDRPDYCTGIAMHFFEAGLAHARKQTAELVEAWIRYSEHERDYNAACDARDWQTCENMDVADFEPVAKLLDALSQLKEQPDA